LVVAVCAELEIRTSCTQATVIRVKTESEMDMLVTHYKQMKSQHVTEFRC
jgi:hypothetical protein